MSCGKVCYRDMLVERLAGRLRECGVGRAGGLLRVEVDVGGVGVLEWLGAQRRGRGFYWANRQGDFAAAGVGAADVVGDEVGLDVRGALGAIERRCGASCGEVRYYGGIAFDAEHDAGVWGGYGRYCFVAPRVEIRRQRGDTTLAVNLLRREGDTLEGLEAEIAGALEGVVFDALGMDGRGGEAVRAAGRTDVPGRADWARMVAAARERIAEGAIDKVVLSRQAELAMSGRVDVVRLMERLGQHGGGAYGFCFRAGEDDAFLGASPECLYWRRGDEIYSEAVAGTVLTGSTEAERRYHRGILSGSAKDHEEHGYVLEGVREGLEGICEEVQVIGQRDIVCLGYVQHFCSRFGGRLRGGVSTGDIINALHPTAAVNGHPRSAALEEIRALEPLGRGWYAGPVGWIGAEESEFAVGIRSGRVVGDRVRLFAGAGIVQGSEPEAEWEETESKLGLFLSAMGAAGDE